MLTFRMLFGRWLVLVLLVALSPAAHVYAQDDSAESVAEDEAKQTQIAARFLVVLEKSPRRGTALDRVYGYHVEFGTLDKFLDELRTRVKKTPEDGAGWMLLGLFESHRGEDGNAVEAFRKAEQYRPQDALAPYYLGQSLILIGQPEQAVDAFERAIARNPPRTDLLEIFQQLGRVHQRAQRTEEALAVWKRLEALFPDDPRVQEQIALTLVDEGQYAIALPRYERLVTLVHDDYRKVTFQIQAAELKIKLNRRDEGLKDFETILANLNPESWLYHDVRRRIEEVFLRTGDQDGLVKYYEKWTEQHADDIDSMARLAKFLASSARVPEATQWMEKALKLAPKRSELRREFIAQLVDEQRFPEAIAQYTELAKVDPGNSDLLREWGKLVLRDKSQELEKRKKEATRIWREMATAHPKDAVTLAQVADLFRQANINEEAIALYQKAVELVPEEPQYREYLGEFYHVLKRPDEALTTWRAIAEGSRRTAVNLARLAQVYNSFGYADKAVVEIAEACKLDPKDFSLELTAADFHSRAQKFDEALSFIAAAEKLASNDDERESVMKARIEVLQSSRGLDAEIDRLAGALASNDAASAQEWMTLARYYEADRRWNEANEAVNHALAKDTKSIPTLATAARIAEQSGDFARAAEMSRQLAQADRRSRGEHLMSVARLESQMGKTDEALKAGKELIAAAPGNTDNYEFFAQLCFRLGKPEEGLDALRKAVRINPAEPHLTTALGSALAEQLRADEAIEVYWRAFDRTDEIDDKTSLTTKLAELYLQTNQFDKLTERLERDRKEDEKRRAATICLAQAYNTAGDYGTARRELESLLSQETQDTNLLQQLSKLCEQGAEIDAAVDYQRRLVQIAPGPETEFRLAGLLQARGDRDEASDIYVKLTQREEDPARLLRSIDSLLTQGSFESVIAITGPRLSQQRDDWELLYREIVAWASLEKEQEAKDRCQRLLALKIPHDKLGTSAAEKFKQAEKKAKSDKLRGLATKMPTRQSPFSMLGMASQIRQAVGLDSDRYFGYSGNGPARVWSPDSFGVARMAAYAWLLKFDEDDHSKSLADAKSEKDDASDPAFIAPLAEAAADKRVDRDTLYDWMYVEQLRNHNESIFKIAKQLATSGGKEEQQFFLSSLRMRGVKSEGQTNSRTPQTAKKTPLSEDELELVMKCYESLTKKGSDEVSAAASGGQIAYGPNGQVYVNVGGNYVLVSGVYGGSMYLGMVLDELKTAGRDDKAKELLDDLIKWSKTAKQLSGAISLLQAQDKYDQVKELYPQWVTAAKEEIAKAPVATARQQNRQQTVEPLSTQVASLTEWMGKLGPEEENSQILSILDPALDLSIEQAKKRRLAQIARGRTTSSQQQYYGNNYQLKYGKEQIYAQVDYPRPDQYVDNSTLSLLREVFEVFKRNDVAGDLPQHLRERLKKANPDNEPYEQLMLSYVVWWNDEHEEAAQLITAAADKFQDDPAFRLETASLHESLGDIDRAMEIVESVTPRDQKLVQRRETLALQLAERLGDVERARKAAERLFGLRLDNDAQLALVERMRRLGLNEMAEAVISRVQRRSGNQTSALATLMAMYQGQGKVDLAQQIAHSILQRTTSPITAMSTTGRNPARYRTEGDGVRKQALALLQQTGDLKEMTQRLESQLAQSPNSPKLYEQLIEYYQAANTRDKVQALLEKAIAQRPDAVGLRYQLAKQLEQNGKLKEACDQYLELLKQKPALLMDEFWNVRNTFTRAQRSLDLVKAMSSMNLKSMSQPWYMIDMVSELLQDRGGQGKEVDTDMALDLFERVFEAYPTYRSQLISRIYNEKLWKNDRVYALAKRGVIPSATEVAAQPWFGVDSISSYGQGGQVNGMFHQLINGINGTDKMADLRKAVEEAVKQNPDWHGGETMLALMDLKQGKKTEAKQRLEHLVAGEDVLKSMPADACWMVGQELDQFEDTRPVALRLFENAVASQNQQNQNQLQYSPVSRLVKLYGTLNRKSEARQLLQKQLRNMTFNQYDPQYASYMRAENKVWAGNQFLELGDPVSAVRTFRELVDDSDALEQAGRWNGNRPEYFSSQVRNGLKKALASMKNADAGDSINQLLAPEKELKPDQAVLDLMISVPDAKNVSTQHLESGMDTLLTSISLNAKIAEEINQRLVKLGEEHPDDLSIPTALALHQLQSNDAHANETLQHLAKMVADKPLDAIPAGRRPNSRQRREALLRAPLWLVARECLAKESEKEVATKLAAESLEAARLQVDNKYVVAILFEWGQLAIVAGDRDTAENKWSELLAAVTKRPERHSQPDASQPRRQPVPNAVPAPAAAPTGGASTRTTGGSMFAALNALPGVTWLAFLAPDVAPATPSAAPPSPALVVRKPVANEPLTANSTPPLTISQFRVTMEIALAAADHGMPKLSQSAVQKAMAGGIPVPDPPMINPAQAGRVTRVFTQPGAAPTVGDNPTETEVATTLRKVLEKWHGDAYEPKGVYELLCPIVLPVARPADVLLYTDTSKLRDAKVVSLGAELVDWARRANKLADLSEKVEARKKNPQSLVPAVVMQTLIDLANSKTPEARGHLEELGTALDKGSRAQMAQLACIAALPAADVAELKDPAFKILEIAVRQPAKTDPNNNSFNEDASFGALVGKVNTYLASQPDRVKAFYESFLADRQAVYSRYGGDYGLYLQWRDWANIAEEAAKSGLPSLALDFMGRVVDFHYQNQQRPSLTNPLAVSIRDLRRQNPQARYETWRNWTLPTATRQTVRHVAGWIEPLTAPKAFLLKDHLKTDDRSEVLQSNWIELLDAARAAGKLDELREKLRDARDKNVPDCAALCALAQLASEDPQSAKAEIATIAKALPERAKPNQNQPPPDLWGEYLICRTCLQNPKLAGLAEPLRTPLEAALRSQGQLDTVERLEYDALMRSAVDTEAKFRPGADSGLLHWLAVSPRELTSSIKPTWLIHEGELTHLPGPGNDTLQFKYPLTGTFTFSADCFESPAANGELGYGSIVVETHPPVVVSTLSAHESLRRPNAMRRPGYNRVEIRVADGKSRYYVNNYLTYEEDAGATSPWPMLFTHGPRVSVFRNIAITGSPVIPREVPLFSGDRMDGWNCTFYGESQPRKRFMKEKPKDPNDYIYQEQQRDVNEPDWQVKGDVLLAKANSGLAEFTPSWLYYQRPLCDQESFKYEFFYSPDTTAISPTLGRLAFLLDPQGISLHWIGRAGWDETVLGISMNNRFEETAARRGPAQLPLKTNDWNQVVVTLVGNTVSIKLNDTEVYEREIEPENSRLIGLFRDKRQADKVRAATLRGPWPEQYTTEIQKDLLATTAKLSNADRRLVGDLINDAFADNDAAIVLDKAKRLSDEERFDLLKAWVLPSPDHSNIRTQYQVATENPSASAGSTANAPAQAIRCPAVELIDVAARLTKLNELRQQVSQLEDSDGPTKCNKLSFLVAASIQSGDDQAALKAMERLDQELHEKSPPNVYPRMRGPAFLAAWLAADRSALRYAALDLSHRLRSLDREKEYAGGKEWQCKLDSLIGRCKTALSSVDEMSESTADNAPRQWSEIADRSNDGLYSVAGHAKWWISPGEVEHVPAGDVSRLYFQSPLRGKFEVSGNLTTDNASAVVATYGGHAAVPRENLKAKQIVELLRPNRESAGELKIPNWGSNADFRVMVDDTKVTTFINGVEIDKDFVTPKPSPWLVLHATAVGNGGSLRNLQIVGKPEIPSEVDMIDTMSAASWNADLYGESIAMNGKNENAVWRRTGEELIGQLRQDSAAKPLEAVLTYLRPMLENGSIAYEFYYVPGEFEVHPAIGRHALVLHPSGVKLHTLTHAQWETENLLPDNETDVVGAASNVTLKANDWNRVVISLDKDMATLSVNGAEVAKLPIAEPAAERFFGLFRFADATKCRVRNLFYRGDWAKELPDEAHQQLADPKAGQLTREKSRKFDTTSVPLSKASENSKDRDIVGDPAGLEFADSGVAISVTKPEGPDKPTGLILKHAVGGDCKITLDFDQLELPATKGVTDRRFGLRTMFDAKNAAPELFTEIAIASDAEGQQKVIASCSHRGLDGTPKADTQRIAGEWKAGRLRISRRGNLVDCSCAEKAFDDFRPVATFPVGDSAILEVQLVGYGKGKPSTPSAKPLVHAVAQKLTIGVAETSSDRLKEKAVN